MGLLDSFEKGLERAVNSAFAKTFRSGIQPVEIASALRSELDKKAAVVSRDRILAPNTFTVRLSPADDENMRALGGALGDELDTLVQKHAKAQGYSFAGPVTIALAARRAARRPARCASTRSTAEGRVAWRGVVDVEGKRHPLVKARTVIGRGSDADITISDAGTSRKHVEILWDGERAMVRDMNSTNGTHAERPQGHRGRAPARLHRHDRPHRHRLPRRRAGRARPSRRRSPPTSPAPSTCATGGRSRE